MPKTALTAGLALAFAALALPAAAQDKAPITQGAGPIKRIPVQKFDVPGTNYETVVAIAEVQAGVKVGRHTHPGPESGYVLEGEGTLLVDGKPPLVVKAGDSYVVPAGTVHDASSGPKGLKVIVTYVVEKGKPLAAPVK